VFFSATVGTRKALLDRGQMRKAKAPLDAAFGGCYSSALVGTFKVNLIDWTISELIVFGW
jgi:hypothetical protein